MKPIDCVPEEALGAVLALPADDPRRAHLDACPRCRALVVSYEAFLAAEASPAAAYGPSEEQALDAARERLLGASAAPGPAPGAAARRAAAPAAPWWAALLAPRLRPAWALAAIAVVATLVVMMPRGADRGTGPELRGRADRPLALAEPVLDATGGATLAWSGMAGAERYAVRFFSAALEPIGEFDAGADTSLALRADQLPAAFGRGELVLVRVVAFQAGDELASSEPRPLPAR